MLVAMLACFNGSQSRCNVQDTGSLCAHIMPYPTLSYLILPYPTLPHRNIALILVVAFTYIPLEILHNLFDHH